jgi:hypothetical protein
MIGRKKSKPQDIAVHIASTNSSPRASVALFDGGEEVAVEEDTKMTDHYVPSQPLSVAIPRSFGAQGPYCPRRPNLSEILSNETPPPWTLSAFMAYLSQNHCLETLEFTMDAARYGKHYSKMLSRLPGGLLVATSEESEYLKSLWQRLMEAYIAPNGPREVNLPSEVRNRLLSLIHNAEGLPPPPNALDTAVQHIYALMEESVLVPFLNSYYPQTAHPDQDHNSSDENLAGYSTRHMHSQSASAAPFSSHSYQEQSFSSLAGNRRSSPNSVVSPLSQSYSPSAMNRASAPSSFTHSARGGLSSRNVGYTAHTTRSSTSPFTASPSPGAADLASLTPTDDDLSTSTSLTNGTGYSRSPSNGDVSMGGLHTPPTTPPMSDCQAYDGPSLGSTNSISSPIETTSPREGAWKRVGRSLGLRRGGPRRMGSGSPEATINEDG